MEDIGEHIQTYCLRENQCCGENFVRASNSYVTLCIVLTVNLSIHCCALQCLQCGSIKSKILKIIILNSKEYFILIMLLKHTEYNTQ